MKGINLLPWRQEKREERRQQAVLVMALAVIAGWLVIVIIHMYLAQKLQNEDMAYKFLLQENAHLITQIKSADEVRLKIKSAQEQIHWFDVLQNRRQVTVSLLDTLPRLIPKNVTINSLTKQNDRVLIKGFAATNKEVSSFIKNMSNSKLFSKLELKEIVVDNKNKQMPKSFVFNAKLLEDSL